VYLQWNRNPQFDEPPSPKISSRLLMNNFEEERLGDIANAPPPAT